MIIWTTAGLFTLVEAKNPRYVKIKASSLEQIQSLLNTLRLIDIEEEIDHVDEGTYVVEMHKDDVSSWFNFELDHWIKEDLGRQFVKLEDFDSAIAYEKLLMNLEK
jgi:hypothetical protein